MANWEIPSFDTNQLEEGKFYSIYVNKDNATLTIPKDNQDAVNAQVEQNRVDILNISPSAQQLDIKVDDLTSRVNNIENEDLHSKFLYALEIATIRKNFSNVTEFEIEYGRKEIISIQVYVLTEQSDQQLVYQESSSTVLIKQIVELDGSGNPTIKKINIKSNQPISGYALIL